MTEEYKKDVLDYMTGKLTPGNQTENQFRDNETIQNNLTQKLAEKGIAPLDYVSTILYKDDNSNFLMYNNYQLNNKIYSFIAIFNQKGEVLDILTTYESGTLIAEIKCLEYDENGYIYGIDYPEDQPGGTDYYRIIQLNNIAVPIGNNYVCRLRSSYYIKTGFQTTQGIHSQFIKKVPGEARYFVFGYLTDQNTQLIEFSNIVGMPIEWNYYNGRSITANDTPLQAQMLINTEEGTPKVDIYYRMSGVLGLDHEYFDGSSLTLKTRTTLANIPLDIQIESSTIVYVSSRKNNGDGTYTLYVYKINNGSVSTIIQYNQDGFPSFYISYKDGKLFSKSESFKDTKAYCICGVYYNNKFIQSPTYEYSLNSYLNTICNVQKVFGLYSFFLLSQNEVHHPNIVIYDNQYSGNSYQDYNSLIPAHSEIYSNGYIQFARDLYNKQVFENQTLAVVNVPFNYLNDMTISPSNLLGQTMTTLVSDKRDITKNKYENVYINFLNKLNVIDEDINQYYPLTANYINKNINVGTSANYNISKLTKVRINFSTPQIISINWTKYYSYYKTTFEVQIEDEIPTSIDFISEDETTTYITKEYHFHKNTTYTISEKVRIGESLQREELMYNNQNVLYDNNQVMVYTKE